MNPKNKDTHKTVYGRAKQIYKAKYMFDSDDMFADFGLDGYADYRFTSKRTFSNGKTLGGFAVVNLGVGVTPAGMNKYVRFGFGIDNLLDKKYEYNAGYPTGGRVYSGTIEIKNLF
jgi:vitamin B12 transporter